ncbi:MAG: ComF family protein [Rickettsiales bacterium]|jgi:ComF family protein|nr:ComF family protein [Rickettsiales bacterium]
MTNGSVAIGVVRKVLDLILDVLYPHKCPSCRKIVRSEGFCPDCWKKLKFIGNPHCVICGKPLDVNIDYELLCAECQRKKYYFNRSLSVFVYNDTIAKAIFQFKFYQKTFLAGFLAKFLLAKYSEIHHTIDFIVPVPLHVKKLRRRGYNQAFLLAKELSKLTDVPCIGNFLQKQTNTKPQVAIGREKRLTNLRSAFLLGEKYNKLVVGKNILIVDDVVTTGTTVNECAKVLKNNGAQMVFVLSLAKTHRNGGKFHI